MKKGISVWAIPEHYSLERIFQVASNAGFDGVEIALAENGAVTLESSFSDMEKIRKLADSYNLELYSVASGLYWKYSLTSAEESTRNKAKSIVRKQLLVASWLGCDSILVVPGVVVGNSVDYDVAYFRAHEAMKELKEDACALKVTIAIENVWNKFLLSPLEMRDFIDQVGSQYVACYFDVGNAVLNGFPEQWIKILGSRIKKVHFKDYKRSVGNINGFVDILSGDVDFPAVMDALKKIGYNDWITAEVGFSKDYPVQSVLNVKKAMDVIMASKED